MSVPSTATELLNHVGDEQIRQFYRQVAETKADWEGNLVLITLAGNAWATLSVCLGHGGPSQHTKQQKARGAEMVQHSKDIMKNERVQGPPNVEHKQLKLLLLRMLTRTLLKKMVLMKELKKSKRMLKKYLLV